MVGDHAKPDKELAVQSDPEEHPQDAEDLSPVEERLPGEAPDLLPPGPSGVGEPRRVLLEVGDLDRLGAGGDQADLVDTDREAPEPAPEAGPILPLLERPAGTGDEVQAGGVVGALGGHRTGGADVAGFQEPDPGQGEIGELAESVDDQAQQGSHRALLGHIQQEPSVRPDPRSCIDG